VIELSSIGLNELGSGQPQQYSSPNGGFPHDGQGFRVIANPCFVGAIVAESFAIGAASAPGL
jgi:hypothetical protein